ncbi:MAG: EamA family transporter [Ruminococcus sp.]
MKELLFICGSGVATGASWLCYYRALQEGPASVVAPIDKLSVLVTVVFSYFVFGERLRKKEAFGLVLLTVGTVAMALL